MPEPKFILEGQGSPVHLTVLVPSNENWHADFALSLIGLHQMLNYQPLSEDFKHNIINQRGSLLPYIRQDLAQQAIAGGATHLLWLDSDMKFPPNLAHRLFKHQLPVVACNYVKRQIPAMPNSKDKNGKVLATNPDSKGLQEASSAGFGAVLMDVKVLQAMEKPWFDLVWMQKPGKDKPEMMGEDVFFFHKMAHFTEYRLFVDHDTSQRVAHLGSFEYTNNLAEATWEEIDMPDKKAEIMA